MPPHDANIEDARRGDGQPLLEGLNPAQRQAVEAGPGPLLILAGPGSGKTRVITHRVAYLVQALGISPHRIMAVTFTNKAAREMQQRLAALLGPRSGELTLGTFHAICARILRMDGAAAGIDPRFSIYDEDDQLDLVKQAMQELDIDPKRHTPRALQGAIKSAKSRLIGPQELGQSTHSYFEELAQRVYERYERLLYDSKALDFDSLIMQAVLLLQNNPQVLARYESRYQHVLVDEFQDTNVAQYALARQLTSKSRNLCVVGDPDQAIYSWRHAEVGNILHFDRDYPEARVALLEQNYRSSQTILEAARQVISASKGRPPKGLWTENEKGVPVVIAEVYDEREEAQFVLGELERLTRQGIPLGGCAILYRTNAQSRVLEEAFMRYGVPYTIVGSVRFYERREVKDVMAYLRLIHNPYDSVSLERVLNVPGRGIGQRTQKDLAARAQEKGLPLYEALQAIVEKKESGPFAARAVQALAGFYGLLQELIARSQELQVVQLLDLVLDRTGFRDYVIGLEEGEERWDNILELRSVAAEYYGQQPGEGLASFLEGAALVSDVDEFKEANDRATLITLHQAKGLEFPVVFITGLEEGILPHSRSMDSPAQLEEERRLFYVGMTRAEKRLYLVHAFRRTLMGGSNSNAPSRYLDDIPPKLVKRVGLQHAEPAIPATPPPPAAPAVRVGDKVRHRQFGNGTVISAIPVAHNQDVDLLVAFEGIGIKRLSLSAAPLERLNN